MSSEELIKLKKMLNLLLLISFVLVPSSRFVSLRPDYLVIRDGLKNFSLTNNTNHNNFNDYHFRDYLTKAYMRRPSPRFVSSRNETINSSRLGIQNTEKFAEKTVSITPIVRKARLPIFSSGVACS